MNESNAAKLITRRPDRSMTMSDRMARNLGWFSIGLGLAEMIAPGRMAKALGLEGKENLLRAYGGREIGAGMWALSDTPAPAIWSRVGGDLLDLGTLAISYRNGDQEQRRNASIAIATVAGITLIDLLTATRLNKEYTRNRGQTRDYSDRSGFPKGRPQADNFETPVDYKVSAREPDSGRQEKREPAAEREPAL